MSRGRLFIISAPSGAGKTTLAKALVDSLCDTVLSVSHTTRARRSGERDGVDYLFIQRPEFERMKAEGRFLEHAEVFGNAYGTSKQAVEDLMAAGKNVILDIDWQGARRVRQVMPDVCDIFIFPPSREELERRLRKRGQDSESVIAERMKQASREMRHHDEYDHVVVNDDFEAALADLRAIITGQGQQRRHSTVDIRSLLWESA